MKGNNLIPIAGELESVAQQGVVAAAESIYDYHLGLNQEDINDMHYNALISLGWIDESKILPDPDEGTAVDDGYHSNPYYEDVTTFYIDESVSESASMVSGAYLNADLSVNNAKSVIKRIRDKSHRYKIISEDLTNGVVTLEQLPDEGQQSINSDVDVVVKLPTFWYKSYKAGNLIQVWVTMIKPEAESEWIKWNGNSLIGAFEGGDTLTSRNTGSVSKLTMTSLRSITTNNNNIYKGTIKYYVHKTMFLLFCGYYGNCDGYILGAAGSGKGNSIALGMNDTIGTLSNTYSTYNFWGLERWASYNEVWLYDADTETNNATAIHVYNTDRTTYDVLAGIGYTNTRVMTGMTCGIRFECFNSRAGAYSVNNSLGSHTSYNCTSYNDFHSNPNPANNGRGVAGVGNNQFYTTRGGNLYNISGLHIANITNQYAYGTARLFIEPSSVVIQ